MEVLVKKGNMIERLTSELNSPEAIIFMCAYQD